jgi:hypothetical protein
MRVTSNVERHGTKCTVMFRSPVAADPRYPVHHPKPAFLRRRARSGGMRPVGHLDKNGQAL